MGNEWYKANRERINAANRERWANDPAFRAARDVSAKKWAEANPGKRREIRRAYTTPPLTDEQKAARDERVRKWNAKNPERRRQIRYASHRGYKVGHTHEEWLAKVELFGGACAYCRRADVKMTKDHVVPVGAMDPKEVDRIDNIVPACTSCNARKSSNAKPAPLYHCPMCGKRMRSYKRTCSQACRKEWSRRYPVTYSPERRAAIKAGINAARSAS